jgi:integrase
MSAKGRPPKPFVWQGKHIDGLRRRSHDRRWILSDGRTFTEPDPAKAVQRFYQMTAHPLAPVRALRDEINAIIEANEREYWQDVAERLRATPQRAAELSGIESLAYLPSLKPPQPLPAVDQLKQWWEQGTTSGNDQKRKVTAAWLDFVAFTGIKRLEDITPQVVRTYRDHVRETVGGKTQLNTFTAVRRMVTFARDEKEFEPEDADKILRMLALLTPNQATVKLDPRPISVADFHNLLAQAEGDDDRALLLVMLNCALYTQEAVRLEWEDFDLDAGTFATRRAKTGKVPRVATLWPATVTALRGIRRRGPHVFYSALGLPLKVSGAEKRFRKMRSAATLPATVTASMLRDGAYTAACNAPGVDERFVRALAGHKSGMPDHYVLRHPAIVRPACEAVREHYLGGAGQTAGAA